MKRSPTSSCSSSSSSCIVGARSDFNVTVARRTRVKRPREANNEMGSGKRSSIYRGVTRHRWTGRYEAHLWDKNTWNIIQNKKGRQIYLGAYDREDAAARAYDLAALKYWGEDITLNFPIQTYTKEVEEMGKVSKEEYLASLRRRSSGFSRGVSKYRGVARHHHNGRWEARIGRVLGNKYVYLGTYGTQEEAAAAYDIAAIEFRGAAAITNFDISTYADKLKQMQQQPRIGGLVVAAPPPKKKKEHKKVADDEAEKQGGGGAIFQQTEPIGSTLMLDPSEEPWNFCLDVGLLPDVPFDKPSDHLPDLYSDGTAGFEEDIDFMFDDDELKVESLPKEGATSSSSSSTIN